jgi:hypothetical protein
MMTLVLTLLMMALRSIFWAGTKFDINTTTFLADAKFVYGLMQEQVSTLAVLMNLFSEGEKFSRPVNGGNIGTRGYTFWARLAPNWNMGFRKEGVTGVGAAGAIGQAQATVNLKYAYIPTLITGQASQLTEGETRAFMQAKALEAKFDTGDLTAHLNVIVAGAERGGQLATVAAAGAGSFTADNAGLLPGALYLRVGMPIDTNAVGGGALTLNGAIISAINYGTRLITVPGTAVNGQAVSLSGEAALTTGDFPLTVEGLISCISDTGALQGLDPAVAGQSRWASYLDDRGNTALAPSEIMELLQFVKNRGGQDPEALYFPSAQINQYTAIATATLRFDVNVAPAGSVAKKALDLGFTVFSFANKPIIEDADMRPDRIFTWAKGTMAKFEAVPLQMANDGAGEWTRVSGTNGIADAIQGLMRWYLQVGITQRSAAGCHKNLTVPTKFQTLPSKL